MPRTMPITISIVPISHRLRNSVSIVSLSRMPRTTIGSEPMMMYQPIRASRWPRYSGLTSDCSQRRGDPPDVLAEVDEHRELGADLDDRGERGARVAPAEELGEDPQVGAARDRQELGQALDGPEEDGLEEVAHGSRAYGPSWHDAGGLRRVARAVGPWLARFFPCSSVPWGARV